VKIQDGGGGHLENDKNRDISANGLTDLYEIRYNNAKQVSSPLRPLIIVKVV